MAIVIGFYDLSTSVNGSTLNIILEANFADSAGDYPPGGPRADQEERRLEAGVIREIEDLVHDGLILQDKVSMKVLDSTPRWHNQIETIFLNARRGRISTHTFSRVYSPNHQWTIFTVETLP